MTETHHWPPLEDDLPLLSESERQTVDACTTREERLFVLACLRTERLETTWHNINTAAARYFHLYR